MRWIETLRRPAQRVSFQVAEQLAGFLICKNAAQFLMSIGDVIPDQEGNVTIRMIDAGGNFDGFVRDAKVESARP